MRTSLLSKICALPHAFSPLITAHRSSASSMSHTYQCEQKIQFQQLVMVPARTFGQEHLPEVLIAHVVSSRRQRRAVSGNGIFAAHSKRVAIALVVRRHRIADGWLHNCQDVCERRTRTQTRMLVRRERGNTT